MCTRIHLTAALALLLFAGCSDNSIVNLTETPVEVAAKNASVFPEVIPLPNGFSPEGVVVGKGNDVYAGSLADGRIIKGNLRTGEIETLVAGEPGLLAVGLAFDDRSNSLFVATGFGGTARVYDADTGELKGSYAGAGAGFVNDVIVTRDAAYLTDSFVPTLYRLPLGPGGALPEGGDLETLPLGGDFTSIPGAFNANGVEATANGKDLLVVNGSAAELYRVDPATGIATKIDVGSDAVASGDGLVLKGSTLYVVQNFLNQIAVVTLTPDLSSATVDDFITSPLFRIPTTADIFGSSLYAVNARFDVAPPGVPNDLEFEIVRVSK